MNVFKVTQNRGRTFSTPDPQRTVSLWLCEDYFVYLALSLLGWSLTADDNSSNFVHDCREKQGT